VCGPSPNSPPAEDDENILFEGSDDDEYSLTAAGEEVLASPGNRKLTCEAPFLLSKVGRVRGKPKPKPKPKAKARPKPLPTGKARSRRGKSTARRPAAAPRAVRPRRSLRLAGNQVQLLASSENDDDEESSEGEKPPVRKKARTARK